MRYFNTSGPCYPEEHYTVMREALIRKGQQMIEAGRYFTIFAPRQSGKTTYFHLLLASLPTKNYTPIWISFENLKTATREEFYHSLHRSFTRKLARLGIEITQTITNQLDLQECFEMFQTHIPPLVLVIDEFEGIPDIVLSELMHTFRTIYHEKDIHALHALILVGVSTIAELVVSSASPFNIAEELEIPYFTREEVKNLIQQYVTESHQSFEPEVIEALYYNTQGQPGLVCGLCAYLVEQVAADRTKAVTMKDFHATLQYYLTRKFDKNLINVVQKAREKQALMLKVLFKEEPIPFSVHDPDIAWLFAHGVIQNVNGYVEVLVPLYSKVLITAFRPLINGETDYYVSAHDTFKAYLSEQGLNLHAILNTYREYVRRRGFRAFDTEHLQEGAWHYSLDGFINFFIERLGGQTLLEVPSGRGRTDILIIYQQQKYLIETKIFTDTWYFRKGKRQLAEYLHSEHLDEGYYVVFSSKHTDSDELYTEEEINGKQIYTYIICTNFDRATDV